MVNAHPHPGSILPNVPTAVKAVPIPLINPLLKPLPRAHLANLEVPPASKLPPPAILDPAPEPLPPLILPAIGSKGSKIVLGTLAYLPVFVQIH